MWEWREEQQTLYRGGELEWSRLALDKHGIKPGVALAIRPLASPWWRYIALTQLKHPQTYPTSLLLFKFSYLRNKTMSNLRSPGFANDIIVVRQPDGTLRCNAVNVRFRRQKEVANCTTVTVSINGAVLKFSLNELMNGTPRVNGTSNGAQGFRFTSRCLESMRLKHGLNHITFTIEIRRKNAEVKARMYLWPWYSFIVIADVDGTITKSDKRGYFMRLFRRDWTQDGVCHLFSAICKNGYQVIYLTGRPRSEAKATRSLLDDVQQDGKFLPKGPVIVSPAGWGAAALREALDTQDEDFKVPVLKQIRELFPREHCPFYAGFGNRRSDAEAYRNSKILGKRIFHINRSKGRIEVKCAEDIVCAFYPGSYDGLQSSVDKLFPPVTKPDHSQTTPDRSETWVLWARQVKEYIKSFFTS